MAKAAPTVSASAPTSSIWPPNANTSSKSWTAKPNAAAAPSWPPCHPPSPQEGNSKPPCRSLAASVERNPPEFASVAPRTPATTISAKSACGAAIAANVKCTCPLPLAWRSPPPCPLPPLQRFPSPNPIPNLPCPDRTRIPRPPPRRKTSHPSPHSLGAAQEQAFAGPLGTPSVRSPEEQLEERFHPTKLSQNF